MRVYVARGGVEKRGVRVVDFDSLQLPLRAPKSHH